MIRVVLLLWAQAATAGVFDGAPASVSVTAGPSTASEQVWAVGGVTVRLRKSPGPDQLPTEPYCAGGGTDLIVEGSPTPAEADLLAAACVRLPTTAIPLASAAPRVPHAEPAPEARPALRWLVVAWLALLAACLPRRAAAWGWAAVGLGVRVAFPGPAVLMAVAYPYERMLVYAGVKAESALYGAGWPALVDVLRPVFGADPERVHALHLVASVLTVAVAWEAAARLTHDRRVAHATGALVATLPLAVALARTEEAFVVCALMQVAAVLGLARDDRWGALLAATSAGLLGNVRPDQLPVAGVLAAALVLRRRPAALVGLVPLGLRALAIARAGNPEDLGVDDVLRPLFHPVGAESPTVFLDPWRTPIALLPLAGLGAWAAGRRAWRGRVLVGTVVLAGWAPYLVFERATDLARFQLPSSTTLCLLAGMGAAVVAEQRRVVRAAGLAVVALGLFVARHPLGGPMVQDVEHALLVTTACAQPAGTVIRYDPALDPHGGQARWLELRCGVRLRQGTPQAGELLLVGRGQRAEGGAPPPSCRSEVIAETLTAPYDGHVSDLGTEPVRIGLYRVRGCP